MSKQENSPIKPNGSNNNNNNSSNNNSGQMKKNNQQKGTNQQQNHHQQQQQQQQQHHQRIPRNNNHNNNSKQELLYGIVLSVKDTFGFIQPICGQTEDNIFFGLKDAYRDIKTGDEICFTTRNTSRGPQAEDLRPVEDNQKVSVQNIKGTITREPRTGNDFGKPGEISIIVDSLRYSEELQHLPTTATFFYEDMNNESSLRRFATGDEVEFKITFLRNSFNYSRAQDIKVTRTKRDKGISDMVQRMLEAGILREEGKVESVRGDFGFIKPTDRPSQIFFRIDDVVDSNIQVVEGLEVEFFVIAENSKGKLRDRAVHLSTLPKGKVTFEESMASNVLVTVTQEPKSSSRSEEQPGRGRLHVPIKIDGQPDLTSIELWSRCMNEALMLRVGDVLCVDVQKYRPEKLYFARNVRVVSFRKIGRESGNVVTVKETFFGFVHSNARDCDVYFRSSEVLSKDGETFLPDDDRLTDVYVSFDVAIDEAKGSSGRLRAIRVQEISQESADTRVVLLKKDCLGMVIKESKRDASGAIKLEDTYDTSLISDDMYLSPDVIEGLTAFQNSEELSEITINNLSSSQRFSYHRIIENKFKNIAHETIHEQKNSRDPTKGMSIKLWKVDDAAFAEWLSKKKENDDRAKERNNEKDEGKVIYCRNDVIEIDGHVTKDLQVIFDLYFDRKTNQKIARGIKLTDEAIPGCDGELFGVLEVVLPKQVRFGFVRSIPSDEKLFWHSSQCLPGTDSNALDENSEVSFTLRRRGGLRQAINIRLLPAGTLNKEEIADGFITAVVVETGLNITAIPLDVSGCPVISKKYWEFESFLEKGKKKDPKIDEMQWERIKDGPIESSGREPATDDKSIPKDSDIKYFTPLSRFPIPLLVTPDKVNDVQLGDIIQCKVVVNWGVQRHPQHLLFLSKLSIPGIKKNGHVTRKLRSTGPERGGNELIELKVLYNDGGTLIEEFYYSDMRDVQVVNEYSRDSLQTGDEVQFIAINQTPIAISPFLIPKENSGSSSRPRFTINAELKQKGGSRFTEIIMAKGPSDDSGIGFPYGWREAINIHSLPWKHVLERA